MSHGRGRGRRNAFFFGGDGGCRRGGGGLALFLDNGETGINWAPTPEPACFLPPAKLGPDHGGQPTPDRHVSYDLPRTQSPEV